MFNGNMSYGRFLDSKQRNGMTWPNLVERRWWPVWGGFFFWLKWRYHVVTLWKIKHGNGKSWEIPYKWRFWWKIINGRFFSTPRLSTGGHIPLHSQYAPFAWWIHHFSSVNPPFFGSETPRLLPQRAARSLVRRDVAMLMIPKYMKF